MEKDYSKIKIAIFFLGLIIVIAASVLLHPLAKFGTNKYIFFVINILLMYIFAFLPILITKLTKKDAPRLFVGGAIYYKGLIIYSVVTVVIIILLFAFISFGLALVLQCVALFAFVLLFALACFTTNHIEKIEYEEKQKRSTIDELREKAYYLNIIAGKIDGRYDDITKSARKISDDMRYLSPSESQKAAELEEMMINILNNIVTDSFFSNSSNSSGDAVRNMLQEFDVLYQQRKNTY